MANAFRHKKYFRIKSHNLTEDGEDITVGDVTFSSTADANTKIGFLSVWATSSPTKTEALADSDKTLVVTYEFDTNDEQTAFQNAIDAAWATSPHSPFNPATATDRVEHFKTEWLAEDGSVGATENLIE